MNIAQALKEKNRIAGRIAKLQRQVVQYNSYQVSESDQREFNSKELLVKLQKEKCALVSIKTRIANANSGIVDKLVKLAEGKAEMAFWSCFTSGANRTNKQVYNHAKSEYVDITFINTIPSKEVSENIDRVQGLIESLQDAIDNYNATTSV